MDVQSRLNFAKNASTFYALSSSIDHIILYDMFSKALFTFLQKTCKIFISTECLFYYLILGKQIHLYIAPFIHIRQIHFTRSLWYYKKSRWLLVLFYLLWVEISISPTTTVQWSNVAQTHLRNSWSYLYWWTYQGLNSSCEIGLWCIILKFQEWDFAIV